ncbi:MAG TPA: hypothetical protein VKA85_10890 [Candidatus Limnocylindrales bacterium]|nr:hypothetical protein [Candidatus Limnocylindrales bacterium]
MSIQTPETITARAREARLRRAAKRQGYSLQRSRWRLGSGDNFRDFRIIDPALNCIVGVNGSTWTPTT